MAEAWARQLTRWIDAGLIDENIAARIRAFEAEDDHSTRWRWPLWLALSFGALTIAAGTLLFVSAHWDSISASMRVALVTTLVAVFHAGGALVAERFPAMATALHAIGTVALGAGIFLAAQIFNLDEHWPGGLLLWTVGAGLASALLNAWPQTALLSVLAPAWLLGEWWVAVHDPLSRAGARVAPCGAFLLALAYFTNIRSESGGPHRRALTWVGGLALIPSAVDVAFASQTRAVGLPPLPNALQIVGWTIAIGLPLLVALSLRGASAWPQLLATVWALVLVGLGPIASSDVSVYAWWALGATGLAAWGVRERRSERINIGAAIFGATVLMFYFSRVMDQLGRSVSLIGLGLLFLTGGWMLERARRRLVAQAEEVSRDRWSDA